MKKPSNPAEHESIFPGLVFAAIVVVVIVVVLLLKADGHMPSGHNESGSVAKSIK